MARKVYTLEGTAVASSAETQLDSITTPTGFKRTIQEIRVYSSQTSGVKIRLYKETDYLCEIASEELNLTKLPYPVTEEIGPGTQLRLTASNSGSSDSVIKVAVIVEETTA